MTRRPHAIPIEPLSLHPTLLKVFRLCNSRDHSTTPSAKRGDKNCLSLDKVLATYGRKSEQIVSVFLRFGTIRSDVTSVKAAWFSLSRLAFPSVARARMLVCLFVGCLTSQQQASVSQGRICSDNFTCCHTEIEVADQTFYLTQSQYTDTGPTSPSADPITPGAWQGSHWSVNF